MGMLVLVFSAILASTLLSSLSLALNADGIALLEIKGTLNDTNNSLSNWNDSDESPCKWTGVSCNPHDQTVLSINLPYMQLGGIISPSIGKLSRLQRLPWNIYSIVNKGVGVPLKNFMLFYVNFRKHLVQAK